MAFAVANPFSGSVVRTPSGEEGLPNVCIVGGHRDFGISAVNVLVYAAPPCTAGK